MKYVLLKIGIIPILLGIINTNIINIGLIFNFHHGLLTPIKWHNERANREIFVEETMIQHR